MSALVPPAGSKADNCERRLRGLTALDGKTGIPTAEEIVAAVGEADTPRRKARLCWWAVGALQRIGAGYEPVIAMMTAGQRASVAERINLGQGIDAG